MLTIYALAVSPTVMQRQYENNKSYQRQPQPVDKDVVTDLSNPSNFKKYLGQERYYHDFLIFFQDEIEKKGWQAVVNEYVFKGDERAEEMLIRMYAGKQPPSG